MATFSDNINQAITDFDDIRDALIDKGQDVPYATPTSTYADKVRAISGGGWQPDPAWEPVPEMPPAGEQCLYVLCGFTESYPWVAFNITGQAEIEWGDGLVESYDFSSQTLVDHTYDYHASPSKIDSFGFKTAVVTIRGNAREIQAAKSSSDGRSSVWGQVYQVRGRIPNVETLSFNRTAVQSVNLLDVNAQNLFSSFQFCYVLSEIFLDNAGTNGGSFFNYCPSLSNVQINTSNMTVFSTMFYNCTSIQTLPQLDTSKGTSFANMFSGCTALQYVPPLDTSDGTQFDSMFYNCYSLRSAPRLDTSRGTRFNNMFSNCRLLRAIPEMDLSAATNLTSFLYGCTSLQEISFVNIGPGVTSISLVDTALPREVLVNIFDSLPNRTSGTQTISVSGCLGTPQLTASDRQIAIDKGWTVTG